MGDNQDVRDFNTAANLLKWWSVLFCTLMVIATIGAVGLYLTIDGVFDGDMTGTNFVIADLGLRITSVVPAALLFVLLPISAVLYFFCTYRMAKNLRVRKIKTATMSPIGTILWNIVPFAAWFMPYRGLGQAPTAQSKATHKHLALWLYGGADGYLEALA